MKLITKRQKILSVPEKWKEEYFYNGFWHDNEYDIGLSYSKVYDALMGLDLNTCSEQDIADIIGNKSWTSLFCYECDKDVDKVVHLGEDPDYESLTFYLCPDCAIELESMFKAEIRKTKLNNV